MTSLAQKLSNVVGGVFESLELPRELGEVRVSDRPDLAQFQCNGAMAAAKVAKKNPREIAQTIVDALGAHDEFSKIEIAGPGFINLNVTEEFIQSHLNDVTASDRLGVEELPEEAVMLDYGGPNIAKPMHVGHLRSSIIGDSLRRICKFSGYNALGDVHMGDWGTQMGMILDQMEIDGVEGPVTMEQLEEIYPKAAAACKVDEERLRAARAVTRKLQDKEEPYYSRWQQFIDVSIDGMKANFDALGVHFDLWEGEASVHDLIAPMVADLQDKSVAAESDGAVVVEVAEDDDKKEFPPLILYKSDGAVMYGTTDLATIVDRVEKYNPTKILYVVDQRQGLHFEQVFRAARKGAIANNALELTHAGFGTMNGPDGKPFKTRAGGVMKLEDLIAMGIEKAQARLDEANLADDIDTEECADIAHKVAIAAIKFADLSNNRISDYVFDLDQMTAFEGKTGPYLLYQAVRIKSLLRKAAEQGAAIGDQFIVQDEDRSLALLLAEFPDHFELALKNYTPHVLCDYAFKLAQAFSSFYGSCHILSEDNEALRGSRLALCDLVQKHITLILELLGISVPERM